MMWRIMQIEEGVTLLGSFFSDHKKSELNNW